MRRPKQTSCSVQLHNGEILLVHPLMPDSHIEIILMQKCISSKTREWRILRDILALRYGLTPSQYKKSKLNTYPRNKKALMPLKQFEAEVAHLAKNLEDYNHPAEWFLRNWKPNPECSIPSWFSSAEHLSLKDVLETFQHTPPEDLKMINKPVYKQWKKWIENNFNISVADFYRFFLSHRTPALEHIKKAISEMSDG